MTIEVMQMKQKTQQNFRSYNSRMPLLFATPLWFIFQHSHSLYRFYSNDAKNIATAGSWHSFSETSSIFQKYSPMPLFFLSIFKHLHFLYTCGLFKTSILKNNFLMQTMGKDTCENSYTNCTSLIKYFPNPLCSSTNRAFLQFGFAENSWLNRNTRPLPRPATLIIVFIDKCTTSVVISSSSAVDQFR